LARETYKRAFEEFGSKDAGEALERLDTSSSKRNGRDFIDLTGDDDSKNQPQHSNSNRIIRENSVERRQRLYELERFKQSLAKRVGKRP
jgi:hypothetical protein